MAVKREFEVVIGEDGEIQIAVKGVKGKKCMAFTEFLEKELGQVADREHTAEYFMPEGDLVHEKQSTKG